MKFGVASVHSCLPPTTLSECPRHKNNTEQNFHLKLLRNALRRETFGLQPISLDKKDEYTWKKQHASTRTGYLAIPELISINCYKCIYSPVITAADFFNISLET